MKINKFNSQTVTEALATTSGVVVGSMAGNVAFAKIPALDDKPKIKRGILMALGVAGAVLVNNKDEVGKFVQGASIGMATRQGMLLLKEIINPTAGGIMETAMGSTDEPIIIYDNSYAPPAIDTYHSEDTYEETPAKAFLGLPQESFQMA